VERFLEMRGIRPLPVVRVSFLEIPSNAHEREAFIGQWEGKADLIEVQRYIKAYAFQPDAARPPEGLPEAHQMPVAVAPNILKRIAAVAPDYLSRSCYGPDVSRAVQRNNTLARYGTIKNYWDSAILRRTPPPAPATAPQPVPAPDPGASSPV
jgi:hypothetical protein